MDMPPLRERTALAERMLGEKHAVAVAVTDEFFRLHPDWLVRYGDRGRVRGLEDAGFHIDFLASAVQSGTEEPFRDYVRWTARMLGARGISASLLAENLSQIGDQFRGRLPAADYDVIAAYVEAGVQASMDAEPAATSSAAASNLRAARRLYLDAILSGNRKAATGIAMEAFDEADSVLDLYVHVFQEAQYEIGRLWEQNRISVAQEHMATGITQFVLAQVYPRIERADADRGRIVITGVEGELHQVGANMVSDVLESQGWDVRFLGTQMPHAGVLQAVEQHQAEAVGISATMLFSIPSVGRLVADVRKQFGTGTRIVLGGAAFRHAPALAAELGADGFADDLFGAVELLCGDPPPANRLPPM